MQIARKVTLPFILFELLPLELCASQKPCPLYNLKTALDIFTKIYLSYDVASGSEITPCNTIDKPLVVYRFTGNVMTSITTLRT